MIKTKAPARRKPAARPIVKHIGASVLVVDDEGMIRKVVGRSLTDAGCDVVYAANGVEALAKLKEALPDLVISDVNMPRMDGFELLTRIRAQASTKALPVILLTGRGETEDVVAGMGLGADDYLIKPFALPELMARVRAKIERPPVPVASLGRDRPTGVLSETRFLEELEREVARARRTKRGGVLAHIGLHELVLLRARFSSRVQDQIELQAAGLISAGAGPLEVMAHDEQVRFMLLLPETSESEARSRLAEMMERIAAFQFTAGDEVFQFTPVVAFVEYGIESETSELGERCSIAMEHAELQLDLQPVRYLPTMRPLTEKPRTPFRSGLLHVLITIPGQIAISQLLAIALPLALYLALDAIGIDVVPIAYVVVVIALLATAMLIWTEGMLALRAMHPPRLAEEGYVRATAIIAAYLPNEAATIVETIRSFQRIDYPAGLQIVLAYNTPRSMPVEDTTNALSADLRRLLSGDGRKVERRRSEGGTATVKRWSGIGKVDKRRTEGGICVGRGGFRSALASGRRHLRASRGRGFTRRHAPRRGCSARSLEAVF